jgi:hypothetical protein
MYIMPECLLQFNVHRHGNGQQATVYTPHYGERTQVHNAQNSLEDTHPSISRVHCTLTTATHCKLPQISARWRTFKLLIPITTAKERNPHEILRIM